jgi:hypothetical protein
VEKYRNPWAAEGESIFMLPVLFYSIELFQSTCDELADWIKEKDNALNTDDVGKVLQATIALQRKHAVGTILIDIWNFLKLMYKKVV